MTPFDPYPPAEFDAFWSAAVEEALDAPLIYDRRPAPPVETPEHSVEVVGFQGMGGRALEGWIALPPHAGPAPGFLWLPPYGRESVQPNAYGTRRGYVSLSFNFHGEPALHREEYTPTRGYFAHGIESPATWVFREMFQNAVIALRVLVDLPEIDPGRVGALGMSQGGGMAIWLAAWTKMLRCVAADMPFLGAFRWVFSREVYRYPLKEIVDHMAATGMTTEQLLETIAYFDTVNQATRCLVPTLVTLGEKDPAVRPEQVEAIHRALAGPKELVRYPGGHDWHHEMIETNRAWLDRNLA